MGIESWPSRVQGTSSSYRGWAALAGYFDGDGTVEFNIHKFIVEIRLAFDENWKPHLEGIRRFLEERSIICGNVRKKESFNTWHLVISRISSVKKLARGLVKHTVKKRPELLAVLQYLDDGITAEAFVEKMNAFVRQGERTGKIKGPAAPFTHETGRELAHRCPRPRKRKSSASEEDKNQLQTGAHDGPVVQR